MSTVSPSSSHRETVSLADRRFVTVDRRGRKPCCLVISSESWDRGDSSFSLRIVLRILQTTDLRLKGLKVHESVVRGLFTTGVTIVLRQSSGTWTVWIERLNIRASTVEMWDLRALGIGLLFGQSKQTFIRECLNVFIGFVVLKV